MARRETQSTDTEERAEEASATRDFVMARLFAARGSLAFAATALDEIADHFGDPADDPTGKVRQSLLESLDAACGAAAAAVQAAMAEYKGIDPEEGEPAAEEEEEDDDEPDPAPAPRRRRGPR